MRAHYHIIPLSLFTYKLFAKARMSISFDITGISLFKWVFTIIYDIITLKPMLLPSTCLSVVYNTHRPFNGKFQLLQSTYLCVACLLTGARWYHVIWCYPPSVSHLLVFLKARTQLYRMIFVTSNWWFAHGKIVSPISIIICKFANSLTPLQCMTLLGSTSSPVNCLRTARMKAVS